ncbi:MAG TPA: TetR/AcrR family transcriptional regulator [Solirubrobacteraceae bacterium]|jgi:AcrR family transcriptional regulator
MADGNATKTALLDAAKQLILEQGYAGTSVRDIAAASGTNLSAVNYHFGSREKLLNQALLESFLEWTEEVGAVSSELASADPNAGPLEHMAAQARPMVEDFPRRVPLFLTFLEALSQTQRSPELRGRLAAHYDEQRRRIVETMLAGRPEGEQPPRRLLEVFASFLLAIVDGLMVQYLLDPQAIPTGDELAGLYETLAALTRASGPAAPAGEDARAGEDASAGKDARAGKAGE